MLPRISKVECDDANYLLFSTSDVISNTLFKFGKWEDHLLKISKFILDGVDRPLVLDVGANLGAYSIPLAKAIQDLGGRVIGFEPQRIVYYQLCANVIINRLDNYYAIYGALGDRLGDVDIPEIDYEINANVGAFSMEKKYRELHGIEKSMRNSVTKVPMSTLDSLLVESPPALIQIDVEGYELSVLRGGKFLEKNNYPPLLFEAWSFDWFEEDRVELFNFVKDLGYAITSFGVSDYLAQHPKNLVRVEFLFGSDGVISMRKIS